MNLCRCVSGEALGETMTLDLNAIDGAVAGSREGLAASGYALDIAEQGDALRVTVRALDGACEDCLVPKPVFAEILRRELSDAGLAVPGIHVVYPAEAGG